MTIHRTATVHVSIHVPPQKVAAFLRDLAQWKSWAPWVRSVARTGPDDWAVETDDGTMHFRFVEPNALGVLDHQVTLPSGETVTNSMRVIPNGTGSELVMVLFQWPHMSAQELDRDVQAVTDDLARLKAAVEGQP
jgi:hypothetical protein